MSICKYMQPIHHTMRYTALLLFLSFLCPDVQAQTDNKVYIYGSITTDSDETYTGFMRWGKEEMYWFDIFNAEKDDHYKAIAKAAKAVKDSWDIDWSFSGIWKDDHCHNCQTDRVFACMFGEMSSMEILRGEKARITFKDGTSIKVSDGYSNDVGTSVTMIDYELGEIRFDWDDILRVDFHEAPEAADIPYGSLLYGTVRTERRKKYTGYIQWDMDERNGDDILDGETRYGCLLYTSPSPRDQRGSRMPSSA